MSATGPQSQPLEPSTLSWEGDKMFNIYIYDYCFKRGFRQTAQHLMSEAEIPTDAKPPINARQGLLFEWWSVFWVLFTAKASGSGTDEALLYTHHQSQQSTQQRRVVMPNQGSAPGQPGPPGQQMPPRPAMNGITSIGPQGPQGQQTPTSRNFPNGPPNGVPGGIGPGPQVNGIGGPQPPTGAPTSGQPSQNFPPQMSARLPMGPGNIQQQQQQQHQQRGFTSPSTDPNGHPGGPQHQPGHPPMGMGQSPHMNQMGRPGGMMGGGPPGGMGPGPAQGNAFPPPPPLGRPPSRTQTPSQQGGMMTQQSPSMATRQPPPGGPGAMMPMGGSPGMMNPQMMNPQQQNFAEEWSKIPAAAMSSLKGELGIEQHKDLNSLSPEEKMRMIHQWRNRTMRRPPNALAGPSNGNQLMAPPPPGPQQRRPGKRSSTSPPDTTSGAGASPPGKRVRRSPVPGGMATPPSYPMNVPGQHGGPQGGIPGPMGVGPPGPMRPPGMGQPMNGFPPGGPGGIGGMQGMHPPPLGGGAMGQQMNRDQLHSYRQSMVNQTGQRLQGLAQSPGNVGSPGGPDGGMGGPPGFPGGPGPVVRGGQPQPPPPPHLQQGQQPPGGLQQQQQQQQQQPGGQQQPKNMPPPPSPKDLKDGIKTEGSPMGPPPPSSTPSANNSGNASTSQTPTPVPPSPSNSMAPTPNGPGGGPPAPPADMFATDFMGIGAMDMETLDHLTFNNGDINFERDFGQWFNPDEIGTSLDIGTNQ